LDLHLRDSDISSDDLFGLGERLVKSPELNMGEGGKSPELNMGEEGGRRVFFLRLQQNDNVLFRFIIFYILL
jgi:hypothetical protein